MFRNLDSFLVAFAVLLSGQSLFGRGSAETSGGSSAPIRYIGTEKVNPILADGGLPLAVGVQSYQVLRASRLYPEISDGQGWTFHHAPMLAYWRGKFYVEFISSPVQENGLPTNVMLASSPDGRDWSMPQVIFPQWNSQKNPQRPIRSQLHQRMGFYVAPNGRLLVISHYGLWDNEKNHIFGGPGHVLREIHQDGSLGPIYFIRYGEGWNSSNTAYPFYKESPDKGFLEACNALLNNPFVTDQWYELEKGYPPGKYIKISGSSGPETNGSEADQRRKALSFYHRKDGAVVGIWKKAWTALSTDRGKTWSDPVQAPGFARTFAKLWGQRTSDDRYAIAYDPQNQPPGYRWPLAVATSEDGITFNHLLVVQGEVPFRRYPGLAKNIGPQYVRGIAEGNPQPRDGAMWLTYSMNKEDLWVSRIPVPIRGKVSQAVNDAFDNMYLTGIVTNWNIYSPRWAPVEVVNFPTVHNRSLRIEDGDPYDYARAIRVFPASGEGSVSFKVFPKRPLNGELDIDVDDLHGNRPVRITLARSGKVEIANGAQTRSVTGYPGNQWLSFKINFKTANQKFSVWMNGKHILENAAFAQPVQTLDRISFRTGPYRVVAVDQTGRDEGYFVGHIDPETDQPLKQPAIFYLDDVTTSR